jgi:hypothetical protein
MAEELSPMDRAKDAFLELLATLEGDELLSFETFVGAAVGTFPIRCTLYSPPFCVIQTNSVGCDHLGGGGGVAPGKQI